jgi:hypothetical protein
MMRICARARREVRRREAARAHLGLATQQARVLAVHEVATKAARKRARDNVLRTLPVDNAAWRVGHTHVDRRVVCGLGALGQIKA